MNPSPNPPLDQRAVAAAVTAERRALCDLLDSLAPDDWKIPSLCAGWTVQDVVAHLTLATRDTTWGMIRETIKARGSFDRMTADTARAHARTFAPSELIRQLRDTADSTRRAPLSSHLDPLTDILVHGQDIARPVGRSHPISPEHAVPALSHAVASHWYGGAKRFRHVALVATDAEWSAGGGQDEARGTAGELLLVATGRHAGLAGLTGPGVDVLAAQMR